MPAGGGGGAGRVSGADYKANYDFFNRWFEVFMRMEWGGGSGAVLIVGKEGAFIYLNL
jgi:hypothetical protein